MSIQLTDVGRPEGEGLPLSDRVRRLEDRLALNALVAKYCHLLDNGSYDALVDLFTPDAAFFHRDEPMASGRSDLRTFFAAAGARFSLSVHHPNSHIVHFDSPGGASGIVSAHAEMGFGGECVRAGLRYSDVYVEHEGAWLFARRSVSHLYRLDWAGLADSYEPR